MSLCDDGTEVTLQDAKLREALVHVPTAHGTHVVGFPLGEQPSGSETEELCPLVTDSDSDFGILSGAESDESCENAFMQTAAGSQRPLRMCDRVRAAPFFDECMPFWRARARDFAPPFRRRLVDSFDAARGNGRTVDLKGSIDTGTASGMENCGVGHDKGGSDYGRCQVHEHARQKVRFDLADEQGSVGGDSTEGTGHDTGSGSKRDGDSFERKTQATPKRRRSKRRSLGHTAQRPGEEVFGRPQGDSPRAQSPQPEKVTRATLILQIRGDVNQRSLLCQMDQSQSTRSQRSSGPQDMDMDEEEGFQFVSEARRKRQ